MEDTDWMTTAHAAETMNTVIGSPLLANMVSEWTIRKLCREGMLQAAGVRVMSMPGRYYVSRSSLCSYIWLQAQDISRRAEEACGIPRERTYEIIGEVGEGRGIGDGQAMDDLWRALMRAEFVRQGGEAGGGLNDEGPALT